MRILLDRTVKLPDIMTILSFLLAVVALVVSLKKDRDAESVGRLNEIRRILSMSLSDLKRLVEINGSIFIEVPPKIIQATEIWGRTGDVGSARDDIWKEVDLISLRSKNIIQNEKILLSYVQVYSINPLVAEEVRQAITELNNLETIIKNDIQIAVQTAIMRFDNLSNRDTAKMGNSIRDNVGRLWVFFRSEMSKIVDPVEKKYIEYLAMNNAELDLAMSRDR